MIFSPCPYYYPQTAVDNVWISGVKRGNKRVKYPHRGYEKHYKWDIHQEIIGF